jgi:magnesium transporter
MHPADLADIVEDLSPPNARRFSKPSTAKWPPTRFPNRSQDAGQHSGIAGAGKGRRHRGRDGARRGCRRLSELEDETSEEILEEMDSEPKTEVQELLEFEEDTAGGMMNTEYVVLHDNATVADAMAALKGNEELLDR